MGKLSRIKSYLSSQLNLYIIYKALYEASYYEAYFKLVVSNKLTSVGLGKDIGLP